MIGTEDRPAKPMRMDKINKEIEIYLNIDEGDSERFRKKYASIPKEMGMTITEKTRQFPVRFGEVWFVDLGINVGSEMDKVRPVLIASANDSFNYFSKLITVVPVTRSVCKYPSQFHVTDKNFVMSDEAHKGDEPVCGVAKAEQVRSVSKGRFLYKMGELTEDAKDELRTVLKNHLGL